MQPTSEERREIAAKLRVLAYGERPTDECSVDAMYIALGLPFPRAGIEYAAIGYLADLIDPTCHIVLRQSDSDFTDEPHYMCSRCGKEAVYVYERRDYTLAGIVSHARYCSYCGARVVDE